MNYSIRFRPEVIDDLDQAPKWYDERRNGLGAEFLAACKEAAGKLEENRERAAAGERGVRSMRISRFPYVIHYRIESQIVVIFAIMFGGRDSSEWLDRV